MANSVTMTSDTNAVVPLRYSYVVGVNDLTVASEPFVADTAPTDIALLVVIEEVEGDDYGFDVTRDGVDWTPIALDHILTDPLGRKQLWGSADVTGLDAGTDVKWRLSSEDSMIKAHAVNTYWRG